MAGLCNGAGAELVVGCRVRPGCGMKVAAYSFGVCQANARMRAVNIVVIAPVGQRGAGMGQRREQGFVQQFVAQPPVEAFDKGVLGGLARRDTARCRAIGPSDNGAGQSTLRLSAKARIAFEVTRCPSSGKRSPGSFSDLRRSEMIIVGLPRRSMIDANSRATRTPGRDVSASEPLSAIGPRSAELFAIGSRTLACGERQVFARAVVDHGQPAEPPPIGELV